MVTYLSQYLSDLSLQVLQSDRETVGRDSTVLKESAFKMAHGMVQQMVKGIRQYPQRCRGQEDQRQGIWRESVHK